MSKNNLPSGKRRFLVVEDHPIYREAVGLMVQNWFPHSVTVGVESVDAAKSVLQKEHFDLVILDIELEDRSGLDLLEECKLMENPPAILVVSGHTRSDYVTRVLKLGASGYVSKSVSKDELEEAIHTVFGGKLFLSKDVARTVAEATIRNHHLPAHAVLSGRELEVFLLLARGLQPKEIAVALGLSVRTVAVHKFKAFHKTGIRNLVELFRYCQENRLLKYATAADPTGPVTATTTA